VSEFALTPDDRRYQQSVITQVTPDRSDIEVAASVHELFRSARAARAPMVRLWNKCYRTLRARNPSTGSTQDWQPNIRIPEIWHHVRNSVGWKMDRRIVTTVSPQAPLGSEYQQWLAERCRDIETVLEATHHVNNEEVEYQKALWDSETYGTAFLKTVWDDTLVAGMGDAVIRRVNPYSFYPDPAAASLNDADYMVEVRLMSLQELDRRFPGEAKHFLREGAAEPVDEPPSQLQAPPSAVPRLSPGAISPGTNPTWSRPGSTLPLFTPDSVVVLEAWVREHDVYEHDRYGEKTTRVEDGWRVIVVAGNRVLLNEKAKDLWSHGWHPYDRLVPHDLGEMWGIGLCELLGPAQSALNRILRSVQQNIELTGNPILREEMGSLSQRSLIAGNQPGTRLNIRQGKNVDWLTPPPLHPSVTDLINYLLARMDAVSGLDQITKGGLPRGRPSADVVDSVQEAGFVSIREQLRNMEATLRGAYTKKAALISENYTEPRFIGVTGPDGEPTVRMLSARHFMRPTEEGGVPLEYNLRIDAGSQGHTSRTVKRQDAMALFMANALDLMTLHEWLESPNPAQIVERLGFQQSSLLSQNPPGKRERARR